MLKGILSVVPRKFVPSMVPAFPSNAHAFCAPDMPVAPWKPCAPVEPWNP